MESNTIVYFSNWTAEDFTYTWAKEAYTFKANSITALPAYLANHFANHLADRELNKENIPTDNPKKQVYVDKCFGGTLSSNASMEKAMVDAMNKPEAKEEVEKVEKVEKVEEAKKSPGRPKKVVEEDKNEAFEE